MGAGALVLALAWTWLAGCVCTGLVDSSWQTDDDHLDYKLDDSYTAMKEAGHGMNIPNPDVVTLYAMEAYSTYYAATHRLAYLCQQNSPTNVIKVYVAVLQGECVPANLSEPDGCLTEQEARNLLFKEVRLSMYTAAASITEASVRTRLQWFQEGGVDDLVMTLSDSVQYFAKDHVSVFQKAVLNMRREINVFKNLLLDRYASGTGSANKMVWSSDAVVTEFYAIIGAVKSMKYPALKLYQSTWPSMDEYSAMFQDHLEAVLDMPVQEAHKDSPNPVANRYWDARALEYAITWLFKMRRDVSEPERKEFDEVLKDLSTKLVAGDMEECLELAGHFLSKAMDRLGHRMFKYLEQPLVNEIERWSVPVPPNLEDLNPAGVPRSPSEAVVSDVEVLIHRYLDEAEEDSIARLVFSQLMSLI